MPQVEQQKYVKRSIQIPETIDRLWTATSRQTGVNKTATLIQALRDYAKAEGVAMPNEEQES